MTKQRLVVHLTNRASVKSAWSEEGDAPISEDSLKLIGQGLNDGATVTLTLPNGDVATFNSRHVVSVVAETWREKSYGTSGNSGVEFDLNGNA